MLERQVKLPFLFFGFLNLTDGTNSFDDDRTKVKRKEENGLDDKGAFEVFGGGRSTGAKTPIGTLYDMSPARVCS